MKTFICKIILLMLALIMHVAASESETTTSSNQCLDVITCSNGNTSKQAYNSFLNDQKAYQCYYKNGDTEMAKIAGIAMTRCQTIYGSINPTIKNQ